MGGFVVLDTNQWDRMPMLRHGLAATLIFLLRQRSARLLLPEPVRVEVLSHLVAKHEQAVKVARAAMEEVRQIMGVAPEIPAAEERAVVRAFEERLAELGDLLEEQSLEPEDFEHAGRMVLESRAPNARGRQQFKDCLIWQSVLRAATENEVFLVTADGGFYAGKEGSDLEAELQAEAEQADHPISAFRSLEELLDEWQPDLDLHQLMDDILDPLVEAVESEISDVVAQHTELTLGRSTATRVDAFVTDVPDELILSGTFEFDLVNPSWSEDEAIGVVTATGTATVRSGAHDVASFDPDRVSIQLMTPHGDKTLGNVVFGRAALGGGRAVPVTPYVSRRVRLPGS